MAAPDEDAEPVARYRLAMWNDVHDAIAGLYDEHAGQGTSPRFAFRIDPEQPLPAVPPGVVVTATCAAGNDTPTGVETPDGLHIAFGRRQRGGTESMPTLAARGTTLVHPSVIEFQRSWRYPLGSRSTREEASKAYRRVRSLARSDAIYGTFRITLVALLLLAVRAVVDDRFRGWSWLLLLLYIAIAARAAYVSWKLLVDVPRGFRFARPRALRKSRWQAASETRSADVTGEWCAGSGNGPILLVTIPPCDRREAGSFEVVGVPDGFDPHEPVPATIVWGSDDRPPLSIEIGGVEMTPVARHA